MDALLVDAPAASDRSGDLGEQEDRLARKLARARVADDEPGFRRLASEPYISLDEAGAHAARRVDHDQRMGPRRIVIGGRAHRVDEASRRPLSVALAGRPRTLAGSTRARIFVAVAR